MDNDLRAVPDQHCAAPAIGCVRGGVIVEGAVRDVYYRVTKAREKRAAVPGLVSCEFAVRDGEWTDRPNRATTVGWISQVVKEMAIVDDKCAERGRVSDRAAVAEHESFR